MALAMDLQGQRMRFSKSGKNGEGYWDAKLQELSGAAEAWSDIVDDQGDAGSGAPTGEGLRKAVQSEESSP